MTWFSVAVYGSGLIVYSCKDKTITMHLYGRMLNINEVIKQRRL